MALRGKKGGLLEQDQGGRREKVESLRGEKKIVGRGEVGVCGEVFEVDLPLLDGVSSRSLITIPFSLSNNPH